MKIYKIEIGNYRLLKSFSLDLQDELTLVIGKNNTGKTSILSLLDKFLNQGDSQKFRIEDFNLDFRNYLKEIIEQPIPISETDYKEIGIDLKLFIEYFENDNLANVSKVMMDLNPDNNKIVLGFNYSLSFMAYLEMRNSFAEFKAIENDKKAKNDLHKLREFNYFFQLTHESFFEINKRSYQFDIANNKVIENIFINLIKEDIGIKEIINFKFISAKRDVSNKGIDKTLSKQTSRIYQKSEINDSQKSAVDEFQDTLSNTDESLTGIYSTLFSAVIEKVKQFGGIKLNDSEIEIISTLQHRELLEGNTTVVYKNDDGSQLPENYNGLGYMNLISMIFEIEILIHEFKRVREKLPADINLLFIEEPEAHTHPQMQYVFIKNIKKLLQNGIVRDDGINRNLQYVITTHSSHIVADSDFNDIKYLSKIKPNSVISKNLKDLENEYSGNDIEIQNFKFLKQYLTLNRAELFFADKAIFVEGETERILLPAMMRKIDAEINSNPLLSQNISIIEVGAHSHIFEKFIDFIGVKKSLIISDIDSYYLVPKFEEDGTPSLNADGKQKNTYVQCMANDANVTSTSNSALQFFHNGVNDISYFKTMKFEWKILRKNRQKKWVSNRKGYLLLSFQTEENGYHARSFEDSFFELNRDFIIEPTNIFNAITPKYLKLYRSRSISSFELAQLGVYSKPSLAIEILINSITDVGGIEFSNWQIPAYIKEGLTWLKQD